MVFVTPLILALAAILYNASVYGAGGVPLAQRCQQANVHCLFAGASISVSGGGIVNVEHKPSGSAIYELSSSSSGTATGCGDSQIKWSFNGQTGVYNGGTKLANENIQGYFNSKSGNVAVNGILGIQDASADLVVTCKA